MKTYQVGTRGSGLALKQAHEVIGKLAAAFPASRFHPLIIRTSGDARTDVPLAAVGGEGVFVKELERALERGEIDLAVHSLKDLPTRIPDGLELAAILPRVDTRDALITTNGAHLRDLRDGATFGTGSLRRRAQLALLNPTWNFAEARGNLETRLAKLDEGRFDALILACAGLERLGLAHRITERLPFSAMLPAPGQGAIAIEIRRGDAAVADIVRVLDDPDTHAAVAAERALLREVEGGCQVPVGAHAHVVGDQLILEGVIAALDGRAHVKSRMEGPRAKPEALGVALGLELLAKGGREILDAVRAGIRATPPLPGPQGVPAAPGDEG
ncbi:MAG: hydroxymethylbilane synthase [Candidatus Sericytochromatia bacterium]|nr:hydroxymethylbilane synthase [Candidatus Tanganyikabacteria bacterium]